MGKVLLEYESLGSTNQCALDLLTTKNKPSEGTVILAHNQTAGRGQAGNSWQSEANKNLTISLILYPDFLPVRQQFLLNQGVALAVSTTVAQFLPDKKVKVKWPNDILVGNRKIAGLLIQNTISSARIQSTIVGIGLNVNQTTYNDLSNEPTSIFIEKHQTIDLDVLLESLCQHLEHRYLQLRRQGFKTLQQDYLDNLYRYQEEALYQRINTGEQFKGTITGIESTGKLIISNEEGEIAFDLKEIKFL